MRKILTIDTGGTFTKFALMIGEEEKFSIVDKDKTPTILSNHDDFLGSLVEIFNAHNADGIALSMSGLIDANRGICITSNALKFLNGHNVVNELSNLCSIPVSLENDANCAALSEVKAGSLRDVNDAIVLVFGTAIGGSLIRDGKIYHGAHNCAGEISYTFKSIDADIARENFCSDHLGARALEKSCSAILNHPDITGEEIFKLIDAGNETLIKIFDDFAKKVAVKIFNLQMIFDPERFALGGGISSQQIFFDVINENLDKLSEAAPAFLPRPQIVPCKYHNDANLFGALFNYLEKFSD